MNEPKMNKRIEFRCTRFDYKDIKLRAKDSGLSVGEYCRRTAQSRKVTFKLTLEELEVYKGLVKLVNNFTALSNLHAKKDPTFSSEAKGLAEQLKQHLNKFK